jgi:BirA family biotin operon repressor/biotin-[acetyl-CoA-carboxylase] ligase
MNDEIMVLDSVDSTNSYLLRNPEYLASNFFAVRAIEQTVGRGRYSRQWDSASGLDLSFSIVFIPEVKLTALSVITIYAGLAVFRVLKPLLGNGLKLKWPNDIYFKDKKICGILCELALNISEKPAVIIGIGVNVNRMDFPDNISNASASIRQIIGREYDIDILARNILSEIKNILDDFRGIPVPENLLNEWISQSAPGEEISYDNDGVSEKGYIKGINSDGTLIIKNSATGNELIYSGEILYGL